RLFAVGQPFEGLVMAENQRTSGAFANIILSRLSGKVSASFSRHLLPIGLELRQPIYEPNEPIQFVYFVELGMISVVSIMDDGRTIEVGTIGKEGRAGAALLLGAKSVPCQYFVQIVGHGYRMDAAVLEAEANQNRQLRELILLYQA